MGLSLSSLTDFVQHPQPCTIILLVFQIGLFVYHYRKQIDVNTIAFKFDSIWYDGEWWRLFTSTFTHRDIWHLGMNMFTLWFLATYEGYLSSLVYAERTLLFIVVQTLLLLLVTYLLGRFYKAEYWQQPIVGFSGVLFSWIAYTSYLNPYATGSVFVVSVPSWAVPWIYLVIIQALLYGRASFTGHLCGLVTGVLTAFYVFDWMTHYLYISLLIWTILITIYSYRRSNSNSGFLGCIKVPNREEYGSSRDMRIVNGSVYYFDRPAFTDASRV